MTYVVKIYALICEDGCNGGTLRKEGGVFFFFGKVDVLGRGIGEDLIDSREDDLDVSGSDPSPSIKTAHSLCIYRV